MVLVILRTFQMKLFRALRVYELTKGQGGIGASMILIKPSCLLWVVYDIFISSD